MREDGNYNYMYYLPLLVAEYIISAFHADENNIALSEDAARYDPKASDNILELIDEVLK